jgi:hypothetical protein
MGIDCDLQLSGKVFASCPPNKGIQPEGVYMLQERISQSVSTRHYLVSAKDLSEKNLSSLDSLDRLLNASSFLAASELLLWETIYRPNPNGGDDGRCKLIGRTISSFQIVLAREKEDWEPLDSLI